MGGPAPTSQPLHRIEITQDFWMADIEVTQEIYQQLFTKNPSEEKNEQHPVANILWTEALLFCNALSERENLTPCYEEVNKDHAIWSIDCDGYRLPTEAEWEYAAKSSGDLLYAGHDDAFRVGWFKEDGPYPRAPRLKKPNAWQLYDMSGNVAEWVFDAYTPYSRQFLIDPAVSILTTNRMARGGGWNDHSIDSPMTLRSINGHEWRFPWIGMRIVRSIVP